MSHISAGQCHCPVSQVLDFVQHARSQGVLTVVAMTQPFQFEGARKAKAADALLADLSCGADVVRHLCCNPATGRPVGVLEAPGVGAFSALACRAGVGILQAFWSAT